MSLAEALEIQKGKIESGIGENVSIISYIDTYLRRRTNFRKFEVELLRNKLVGLHPSELGNACPRAVSFRYLFEKKLLKKVTVTEDLFEEKDNLAYLERIFDNGHVIHSLIYSYLEGVKEIIDPSLEFRIEVPIKKLFDQFLIGGTADILIKLQDGEWYYVDIKTANSNVFNKLKSHNDISRQYKIQANIYGFGLGVKRLCNLYWNKDTGKMKEFFFFRDDDLLKGGLTTALLSKKWISGEIDNIQILDECEKQEGKFNSCDYASMCFSCSNKKELLNLTTAKSHESLVN